ncbi:hypothetical protein COV12_02665 [Candidatus Woesearchaeota archaeon CG10_big_fil_rev_8_21_14_0_10_32_24]|nr:MAG: hypothetical protein COV12_02665 [Candidatus Woesearchaeota archaeon CG10_big_fil_rev_8_21_14_0_10_32_24]
MRVRIQPEPKASMPPVACEKGVTLPSRKEVVNALYEHVEGVNVSKGVTKKGLDEILRKYL